MNEGLKILKALQRQGFVVSRAQDGKRLDDAKAANLIEAQLAITALTPGQKVLKALAAHDYAVMSCDGNHEYSRTDNSEIAGIIEQETGVAALRRVLENILAEPAVCHGWKVIIEAKSLLEALDS